MAFPKRTFVNLFVLLFVVCVKDERGPIFRSFLAVFVSLIVISGQSTEFKNNTVSLSIDLATSRVSFLIDACKIPCFRLRA